jgi:hypothetical protein
LKKRRKRYNIYIYMKKIIEFLDKIAAVLVIGFSMFGCASFHSDDGGRNMYSSMPALQWPTDIELERFGLSGLRQPPETSEIVGQISVKSFTVVLQNTNKATFDYLAGQIQDISEITVAGNETNTSASTMVFRRNTGETIQLVYSARDNYVFFHSDISDSDWLLYFTMLGLYINLVLLGLF